MPDNYEGICAATQKRQYSSRRLAMQALDRTTKYLKEDPMTWNAYVCKCCEYWHIGHIRTQRVIIYGSDEALVNSIVHE